MRNRIAVFFFIILCARGGTAQDQGNPKRPNYVVVPSESVLLVAASQPDCPIEIVGSKLLNASDGSRRTAFQYELRNRGTKPIKYVSVYSIASTGIGGGPLYNGHSFDAPLMPGEKISAGEPSRSIMDLTPQLREKLKLAGPLRAIVVLLVWKVGYADGSAFSDMNTIKALEDYFVDINSDKINSRANGTVTTAHPSKQPIPR